MEGSETLFTLPEVDHQLPLGRQCEYPLSNVSSPFTPLGVENNGLSFSMGDANKHIKAPRCIWLTLFCVFATGSDDGETGVLKIITSNCLKCICEVGRK